MIEVPVGRQPPGPALLEQTRSIVAWLQELSVTDFAQPSVLPGWDVRLLTAHLVMAHQTLLAALEQPSTRPALPMDRYVQGYRPGAADIADRTEATAGDRTASALIDALTGAADRVHARLESAPLPSVVTGPRGPIRSDDLLATRIIEVVVHSDDLSRSLPDRDPVPLMRGALGRAARALTAILAGQHPGRSVEVRIPPYAAVQCSTSADDPGPTHTRGTPPNVVETDVLTFVRLATGRTTWAEEAAAGQIHASGLRADLTPVLPLLS